MNKIDKNTLDIVAKLTCFKAIHWEWEKILENKERNEWDTVSFYKAIHTSIDYKCEEETHIYCYYKLEIGKLKFLVVRDPISATIKVYHRVTDFIDLEKEEPFLTFSENIFEHY